MKDIIRAKARELGFDDCRFTTAAVPHNAPKLTQWLAQGFHGEMAWLERNAHKRIDPQQVLAGAKSMITLATGYSRDGTDVAMAKDTGVIARYARFADYHEVIGKRLAHLAPFVNSLGENIRSLWYVDTGPLLERDLAQRAGLGFIGKHTNLISRALGNWIFLSEIITTLEIEADLPEKNRCGTCERCITACPTEAIRGPFLLDSRRCISYLTIEIKGSIPEPFRPLIGNRVYGCDDCLAACPWNRFAKAGRLMKEHARPDLDAPQLLELLALDEAQFKRKFAGTPVLRTKRRGLLRNVCVALGNVGDERHLQALEKATHDPEPLVQEHARWAINRIRARTAATRTEQMAIDNRND